MYDRENQMDIEVARDNVEKVMLGLPATRTDTERRMYLAGVIDTYQQFEMISEQTRGNLYTEFCF